MFFGSENVLLSMAARTAMNRPGDGYFVERKNLSRSNSPALTRSWKISRTWSASTLYCTLRISPHSDAAKFLAKLSETSRDVPDFTSTKPAPVMRTDTRRTGSRLAL